MHQTPALLAGGEIPDVEFESVWPPFLLPLGRSGDVTPWFVETHRSHKPEQESHAGYH